MVGILHGRYPEMHLTTEELKALQEGILEIIRNLEEGMVGPQFLGSTFKPGRLLVNCADETTAEWLKGVVPSVKPWEGVTLRAIDEKEIPKATIVKDYFPSQSVT
uniref:DUF4780 domain-containing protein n=1 Tax=Photinus pyralis TaxID=7054 RepID=A0A1Y1N1I1_PHOPY